MTKPRVGQVYKFVKKKPKHCCIVVVTMAKHGTPWQVSAESTYVKPGVGKWLLFRFPEKAGDLESLNHLTGHLSVSPPCCVLPSSYGFILRMQRPLSLKAVPTHSIHRIRLHVLPPYGALQASTSVLAECSLIVSCSLRTLVHNYAQFLSKLYVMLHPKLPVANSSWLLEM